MAGFKNDLTSFYKFTTPVDMLGKVQVRNPAGESTKTPSALTETLMKYFVEEGNSLRDVHRRLGTNKPLADLAAAGAWAAVRQGIDGSTESKPEVYWKKGTLPGEVDGRTNFYSAICGAPNSTDLNPVEFGVNILRAPMLTHARRSTDLVELYLNHMPPLFANQLMPYCDVEFQIPPLGDGNKVNRPSLYRFLVGSGQDLSSLTEADKSLATFFDVNSTSEYAAGTSAATRTRSAAFLGTEMFTSPQTLTNMNTLVASTDNDKGARLGDVRPFLPPASITSLSFTDSNAQMGVMSVLVGSLTMVIHDKARLPEFSEFLQIQTGYKDIIVWVTYGMLAPRGRGDEDHYAKFINENMLRRVAFTPYNVQYTINDVGSVEVQMQIKQAFRGRMELTPIDYLTQKTGKSLDGSFKKLQDIQERIRKNAPGLGKARSRKRNKDSEEKFDNPTADLRVYQIVQGALRGEYQKPFGDEGRGKDMADLRALLSQAKTIFEDPKKSNLTDVDSTAAAEILDDIAELYGITYVGMDDAAAKRVKENKNTSIAEQLKSSSRDFVKRKFETTGYDPFLPSDAKNEIFSVDFIKSCTPTTRNAQSDSRPFVSYGKLFLDFCLQAILMSAENNLARDLGVSKEQIEVQFNFYQLNSHLGPASLHNIAELPLDFARFAAEFEDTILKKGRSTFTIQEFIKFLNDQASDIRQPGYGRRPYYEPYDVKKPEAKEKRNVDKELNDAEDTWGAFQPPNIAVDIALFEEKKWNSPSDLLTKLQDRVGGQFARPLTGETSKDKKYIVRISIYDIHNNPFEFVTRRLRSAPDGSYYVFRSDKDEKEFENDWRTKFILREGGIYEIDRITNVSDETPVVADPTAVQIGDGLEALKNLIGSVVPRITPGANGCLVSAASIRSMSNAQASAALMTATSYPKEQELSSNGLTMKLHSLPLTLVSGELTFTSPGCPIARPFQQYFIDLGTSTTLDTTYQLSSLVHNFSPGKYETQWTFKYADGWPQFRKANDPKGILENFLKEANSV